MDLRIRSNKYRSSIYKMDLRIRSNKYGSSIFKMDLRKDKINIVH